MQPVDIHAQCVDLGKHTELMIQARERIAASKLETQNAHADFRNLVEARDQDREFLQSQVHYLQGELSSIQNGMMNRLGLSPVQGETRSSAPPQPVQTRAVPWNQKAATLEAQSRNDYYTKKIDAIEEADKERAKET